MRTYTSSELLELTAKQLRFDWSGSPEPLLPVCEVYWAENGAAALVELRSAYGRIAYYLWNGESLAFYTRLGLSNGQRAAILRSPELTIIET
jgi:hypothetical protein